MSRQQQVSTHSISAAIVMRIISDRFKLALGSGFGDQCYTAEIDDDEIDALNDETFGAEGDLGKRKSALDISFCII